MGCYSISGLGSQLPSRRHRFRQMSHCTRRHGPLFGATCSSGICYPRMMVVNPRHPTVLWLVPRADSRNAKWLGPLRRALSTVDTVLLFPPLDRGEGVPEVPVHQALLHYVIEGLTRK
jgi:hypothetical protein